MREESKRLWEQALEDFKTAQVLLESERFYASVFFSQQAAEKALKALYIETKKTLPPRTHSLIRLLEELGVKDDELIDAAMDLTPEYILLDIQTQLMKFQLRFIIRKWPLFI